MEVTNGSVSLAVASIITIPQATTTTAPSLPPADILCMKMLSGGGSTNPSIGGSANNCLDR